MRRTVLFLSRFLVGLWIVLAVSFLCLLVFNAPNVPSKTPFAGISIKTENSSTIHLPNRIFNCTETGQQFQCQTNIQDRLLELSFTSSSHYKYELSDCRALYDKQAIGCSEIGQTYAPMLSKLYEITDLKLSPQQLLAVKQKYWGVNALAQLGELRLMWIGIGLSLAAGLSVALLVWFYPGNLSKAFTSLACGFGVYRLVGGTLGRVQYSVVTPYGITPDAWNWIVSGGAIAAGVGTILVTAFLLWRRSHRFIRVLISSSSSMGIFSLCSLSLLWIFTFLFPSWGSSNAFSQYGYLMMWASTAISSIFAVVAAILFFLHTRESIKKFLCLGSGLGTVALGTNLFLFVLLVLGYAD